MTGPEQRKEAAAAWITAQPPGASIPDIRSRFTLSAKEACEAVALARKSTREAGQ